MEWSINISVTQIMPFKAVGIFEALVACSTGIVSLRNVNPFDVSFEDMFVSEGF